MSKTGFTLCNAQCQGLAQAGAAYEATAHADPTASFYKVPSNFSTSLAPGLLLRVEQATSMVNYSVPSGLTMSRILYTTKDLNGTTIPASAYILWPYQPLALPAGKGYPLVAWAHGTSGQFGKCSPSNYHNLQYHFMAPFVLAMHGMVVVAPDYAGLGVDTLPSGQTISHPWLASPAHANDLAYAIAGARAAFPSVLKPKGPFVAMGHSQGGGAAWAFAERQVSKPVDGYLGTVAIAPITRIFSQYELALSNTSLPFAPLTLALSATLVASVTAVYPAYNFSGMTDISRDRWLNVLKPIQGCFPTSVLVFSDLNLTQLVQPGWEKAETVQQFANRTAIGGAKFKGPMLVIGGGLDTVVSVDGIKTVVNATCSAIKGPGPKGVATESLEMVTYETANHFPQIQASQSKWLEWVKDRFMGAAAPKAGCTSSSIAGLRSEFTFQTPLPNFLEDWVDPNLQTEGWKYFL
ncbi:Alpha/Beta hydrolase protein [Echria macrotheca]|uniref:Alpha/Beta hydrolase protein n=1 Tax=Echria macrotheca TaxID=438768 RepID=A0AAJ0B3Z0_9PEZI|nr:Alpha/Beta hydrolase protein [Echria macrotheca]